MRFSYCVRLRAIDNSKAKWGWPSVILLCMSRGWRECEHADFHPWLEPDKVLKEEHLRVKCSSSMHSHVSKIMKVSRCTGNRVHLFNAGLSPRCHKRSGGRGMANVKPKR